MKAGRELDALVAEKVFGWERRTNTEGGLPRWVPPHRGMATMVPNYSTDIATAWTVVEALKDRRFACRIVSGVANGYNTVTFYDVRDQKFSDIDSGSVSVPHGICLAALKVVAAL